jgi:NAD(P)-dependent dehydrogenase (short-subunit alcohol dehydrogenase family)
MLPYANLDAMNDQRVAVVLGARNLGGAILDHLIEQGWQGAAIVRSEETAAAARRRGALGMAADAADPAALDAALARVRSEVGPPRLLVNAVSASRPPDDGKPFGGGPLAQATLDGFRGWTVAVAEQAFVFLSAAARTLRESGGGTLIQVTGGSARRAMPDRGLWSAGAQATRAMVHAAAQELRADGIHAALLIVDATIESPKTESYARGQPPEALADQRLIAEAVTFLAEQQPRAYTHELMVTPAGDRWVP